MGKNCHALPPAGVANISFAVKVCSLFYASTKYFALLCRLLQEEREVMAEFWPWPGESWNACATAKWRRIEELVVAVRLAVPLLRLAGVSRRDPRTGD